MPVGRGVRRLGATLDEGCSGLPDVFASRAVRAVRWPLGGCSVTQLSRQDLAPKSVCLAVLMGYLC